MILLTLVVGVVVLVLLLADMAVTDSASLWLLIPMLVAIAATVLAFLAFVVTINVLDDPDGIRRPCGLYRLQPINGTYLLESAGNYLFQTRDGIKTLDQDDVAIKSTDGPTHLLATCRDGRWWFDNIDGYTSYTLYLKD